MDFPRHIQIQTQSMCSGSCSYCPHPNVRGELPQGIMPYTIVRKLLDEVTSHKYDVEHICLYLMNEPLLDPRILKFIDYIDVSRYNDNEKIIIELSTNCHEMTEMLASRLSEYPKFLLLLNINERTSYRNVSAVLNREWNGIVKGLLYKDYMPTDLYWQYVNLFKHYDKPYENGVVDDRAGNVEGVPNHTMYDGPGGHCLNNRPNEWMHILWNGDVILCCQDWRRTFRLGNVNDSTIAELAARILENYGKPRLCNFCARWVP